MHEFAIAQALVEAASREAKQAGAHRVTSILCRVGVMRQVNGELLTEAFAVARLGGPCESAELRIERVPMRVRCRTGEHEYEVKDWDWTCPRCGGEPASVTGGDELDLVSIEAEVEDADRGPEERLRAQRQRSA